MNRRKALVGVVAMGVALQFRGVIAQTAPTSSGRVAFLHPGSKENAAAFRAICAQLGDLGWNEGKTIHYEWRFAAGQLDQLPRLIQELLAGRPDVLLVGGNQSAQAALQLTRNVPIVLMGSLDPVGSGFAKSLSKPGGSVTGVMWADPQVAGKIVELFREVAPNTRRLAVMFDARVPGIRPYIDADRAAAISLGIEFKEYGVHDVEGIGAALDSLKGEKIGALKVAISGLLQGSLRRILEETRKNNIPVISTLPAVAEQGAVLTYSPSDGERAKIAARQVDRILRGAKPADMPFEYTTRMEVTLNVRAAKALGITVPSSTLLRADRVID